MFIDNPATWTAIKENYNVTDYRYGKMLLKEKVKPEKTTYKTVSKGEYKFNQPLQCQKGLKKQLSRQI